MKKLALKAILFAAPVPLWIVCELFILPIDTFTYRVWEAVTTNAAIGNPYLKGPFYPNLHIVKLEGGSRRIPNGLTKRLEWYTDEYGYRNRPSGVERYDVVTIGDSHVAGAFLDQPDTLAETLARACGCLVYNHGYNGPPDMERYLRQERFAKAPPGLVVFEFRPVDLYNTDARYPVLPQTLPADQGLASAPNWRIRMEILHQRFDKKLAINWARARLGTAIKEVPWPRLDSRLMSKSDEVLFAENGAILIERFRGYKREVEARGSEFVLFLIALHEDEEKVILPKMKQAGFEILSLPPIKNRDEVYFQQADDHWTEAAVRAAAGVVASYVKERGLVAPRAKMPVERTKPLELK
jgi:alginate O-acetyltransferase complex protein AlgJ